MKVGRYQVVRELARGGMGVVYEAQDPSLARRVALKVVLTPGGSVEDLQRFQTEQRAVGRLRHPNVVAVHDCGLEDGKPFLVMDLIEGGSLAGRLEREGPLPAREAARIARTLADALAHAHAQKVLHRDLKPQNVLLDAAGEAFLTDFGLARLGDRDTRITLSGEVMGTPVYMPPEQADGRREEIGPRSDVYGLGAILYHMLTGQPPFRGAHLFEVLNAVLSTEPERPGALRADLDPGLEAICLTCLAKAPGARYAGMPALRDALDDWLSGASAPPRRAPGLALAGVGALALGLGAWAWAGAAADPPAAPAPASSPPLPASAPAPPPTPGAGVERTFVIQPGPIRGLDTIVRHDWSRGTDNYGAELGLIVGDRTRPPADMRSYLKIELEELPPDADLRSARLELYLDQFEEFDRDLTLDAHEVLAPWKEGTSGVKQFLDGVSWSAQPPVAETAAASAAIVGKQRGWVALNVTASVRRWLRAPARNHGWQLRHRREGAPHGQGRKVFCSSDFPEPSRRPKLTVTYRGGPPRPVDEAALEAAGRARAEELLRDLNAVGLERALERANEAVVGAPFFGRAFFERGRLRAKLQQQQGRRDSGCAYLDLLKADHVSEPFRGLTLYRVRLAVALSLRKTAQPRQDLAELRRRRPDDPMIPRVEAALRGLEGR